MSCIFYNNKLTVPDQKIIMSWGKNVTTHQTFHTFTKESKKMTLAVCIGCPRPDYLLYRDLGWLTHYLFMSFVHFIFHYFFGMLYIPRLTRKMKQDMDSDMLAWLGMQMKQALIERHHSIVSTQRKEP